MEDFIDEFSIEMDKLSPDDRPVGDRPAAGHLPDNRSATHQSTTLDRPVGSEIQRSVVRPGIETVRPGIEIRRSVRPGIEPVRLGTEAVLPEVEAVRPGIADQGNIQSKT